MPRGTGEIRVSRETPKTLPKPPSVTEGRAIYDDQLHGLRHAKAELQQRITRMDAGITELERRRDKYFPAGG